MRIETIEQNRREISIIRFIIANMDKIVKEGITLTDVTEGAMDHPHYKSRVITEIYYDHKKGFLVNKESRSGSPSCWNHYKNNYQASIFDIARWIASDINAAKTLFDEEDCEVGYMDIEGF